MTLAMFMLVVFTLDGHELHTGCDGRRLRGHAEALRRLRGAGQRRLRDPIPDMKAALEDAKGIQNGEVDGRGRGLQPPGGGQAEGHRPRPGAALRAGRGRGLLRERRLRLPDDRQGLRLGPRGMGGAPDREGHGRDLLRPRALAERLHLRPFGGAARQAHRLLRRRRELCPTTSTCE